ncbi:MAG: HD family phosphohydrolase [Bacillota bacterium]|jgi:putative nucleotidyltransferase with HDIG domain
MVKNIWDKDNRKVLFAGKKLRRRLWWFIFIAITVVVLAATVVNPQVSVKEGEIAQEDLYYKGATITYTSQIRTTQLRNQMAGQVEQIYRIDEKATREVLNEARQIFTSIKQIKDNEQLTGQEKLQQIKNLVPGNYQDHVVYYILAAESRDLIYLENVLTNSITNILQTGVLQDELPQAIENISAKIEEIGNSADSIAFLQAVLNNLHIVANKEYDAVATAAEVERLMNEVEPVQVTVQSGEKILSKNSPITAEQIEALYFLGMQSQTTVLLPYLGVILFVLIIYSLLLLYLRIFHPQTRGRESNIVLIGAIFNFTLILSFLFTLINISDNIELSSQVGYLMPVAAASMLLMVLLGRGISIFITVLLSICIGIMTGGQLSSVIVALVGGIVAIFSATTLYQRGEFVKVSFYIVLANVVTIAALGILGNQTYSQIGVGMILGVINGIFAAILTIGLLPFLEGLFGVTTVVRLLELSNSNHPLLKRLMMEAPGTYHHSILVGNLAEAAAQAVHADALLVRVASYYHDIGKLKRPYFFIENQLPGENPHDKLQPTLSMLIISSHVKSGVEILRQENFPYEIIDIVEQHHGTGVLNYFYHKALETAENPDSIKEADFSYPGPNPQTKEAAIVMLADSVQAAVQAMENPHNNHLGQKVRDIIKYKMDHEQLHECNLTFKDLEIIAQAFMKVLAGIHHSRVVYPEEVAKEIGGYKDADLLNDAKSAKNSNSAEKSPEPVAASGSSDSEQSRDSKDA